MELKNSSMLLSAIRLRCLNIFSYNTIRYNTTLFYNMVCISYSYLFFPLTTLELHAHIFESLNALPVSWSLRKSNIFNCVALYESAGNYKSFTISDIFSRNCTRNSADIPTAWWTTLWACKFFKYKSLRFFNELPVSLKFRSYCDTCGDII